MTVRLASGEDVRGAALIGADGLWSNVRKQVVGDGPPRVSGHTTYRSVIPTERMPEDLRWNAATLWAGPKCHIVHYPLQGWKVFNLVVTYHNDAPEPVAGKPVPRQEVLNGFEHVNSARSRSSGTARTGSCGCSAIAIPVDELGRRPGYAARRRSASDDAVFCAGRLHGDGGRGVSCAYDRRTSRAHRIGALRATA